MGSGARHWLLVLVTALSIAAAACGAELASRPVQPKDEIPTTLASAVRAEILGLYAEDLNARALSAYRLGQMGEAALPAIRYLLPLVRNGSSVRFEAGTKIAESSIGNEASQAILKMGKGMPDELAAALEDKAPQVREGAAAVFRELKNPKYASNLIPLLSDKVSDVREMTAIALGDLGHADAIAPLIEAIGKEDHYYTADTMAGALASLKAPQAVDAILGSLKKWIPVFGMHQTAGALARLGAQEKARTYLLEALTSADEKTRGNAATALGYLGDKAAVPGLVEAFGDKAWRVRASAAFGAGMLKDPSAREPLAGLLKDSEVNVRIHAVSALGNMGDGAIESVVPMLKDPEPRVRAMAASSLRSLWLVVQSPLAMATASDAKSRAERLRAWAKCGAMGALVEGLKDSSADVRTQVLTTLQSIGQDEKKRTYDEWAAWLHDMLPATTAPAGPSSDAGHAASNFCASTTRGNTCFQKRIGGDA